MAWTSTTVRAASPSPMEPRLGRMFHSSATGRRRDAILPNQSRPCQVLHQTPISSVGGPWFGSRRHGRSLLLLPRLSSAAAHPSFVIDVDKLGISPQDSVETVISNEWSDRVESSREQTSCA